MNDLQNDITRLTASLLILGVLAEMAVRPGQLCVHHRAILESDRCTTPGCPGHGWTIVPCDERCPSYRRFT